MDRAGAGAAARRPWAARLSLLLACYAALWGLLGWHDLSQQTRAGFVTDGAGRITDVEPGGPAEQAGLQAGDRVVAIDGNSLEQAGSRAAPARLAAGAGRSFRVERNGTAREVRVTYRSLPVTELRREQGRVVLGWLFLLFPMMALQRRSTLATRVLMLAGTGLSLALLRGPELAQPNLAALALGTNALLVAVGFAAVLHFHLAFPVQGRTIARWPRSLGLYVPAVLATFPLWLHLGLGAPPAAGLDFLVRAASSLAVGAYLLISLFLLLRNYARTHRAWRRSQAINVLLWSTVGGILPALLARLVELFSPASNLPGQEFWFLSLVLIPAGWAWSASRPAPAGTLPGAGP